MNRSEHEIREFYENNIIILLNPYSVSMKSQVNDVYSDFQPFLLGDSACKLILIPGKYMLLFKSRLYIRYIYTITQIRVNTYTLNG